MRKRLTAKEIEEKGMVGGFCQLESGIDRRTMRTATTVSSKAFDAAVKKARLSGRDVQHKQAQEIASMMCLPPSEKEFARQIQITQYFKNNR